MMAQAVFPAAAVSERGRRPNNEDRTLCEPESGVYAVIDGVGGGPCGEEAAEIALAILRDRLRRVDAPAARRVREAIALSNAEICRQAKLRPEMMGAGCVVVAAVVEGDRLVVGHVGDSRAYLLRGGSIHMLTNDHAPVAEMERRGDLTEGEAMTHPLRHQVYRALGAVERDLDAPDFIDVDSFPFDDSCALLLASDGLTDALLTAEIREVVEATRDPRAAAARLVGRALERGAKDNISVVLVVGPLFSPLPTAEGPRFELMETGRPARRWLGLLVVPLLAAAFAWGPALVRPAKERRPAPPRIWEVFQGPGGIGSIARAIEQANPGDTVVVRPGEYKESLQLKNGVTVVAEPRRGASLEANGPIAIAGSDISNARISGFRIASTDGRLLIGVLLTDSSVALEDLDISGARHAGVQLMGKSRDRLLHCRVHDNLGAGIRILDAATPVVAESIVAGNGQPPELAEGTHADVSTSAMETVKDLAGSTRFKHGR
jgi:protein phosphatase